MRRILAVLVVTLALFLGTESSSTTAQAPVHTFSGFPTDFLLDGSEVTLPFLLIAETPGGLPLAQATVDPCCQWAFEVPVLAGESLVVFILSEPNDPSRVRGTSEPLPIVPGGQTPLDVLRFQSGERFREIPPVRGRAGQGRLLPTPPLPTAEDIRIREAGLSVANPDELINTFAAGPVVPPRIPPSEDLLDVEELGTTTGGCGERTVQLHEGFNLVGYTGSDARL